MKTSTFYCTCIFISFGLTISSCKKDTPPEISLNGDKQMTAYTHESFNDPGATATDNEDGDISSNITVSGSVESTPGYYYLTYSVEDSDGNLVSTSRDVTVTYKNTYLDGTYDVVEVSPVGGTDTYTGNVTADSGNDADFVFGSLTAPGGNIVIEASVSNLDDIAIRNVVEGAPIDQFTGDITDNGTVQFELSYYRNINGTYTNCTATWTKQ